MGRDRRGPLTQQGGHRRGRFLGKGMPDLSPEEYEGKEGIFWK